MPLLSVVSVTKDDPEGLDRTLGSLSALGPDPRLEVLVVDGSADRAAVPAVLERHSEVNARYVWREPAGVYPAMNDGLALATGDYLLFLNAGDTLADHTALDAALIALQREQPLWAFGSVRFIRDGHVLPEPAWDYKAERARCFARGRFPAHQGTFVRRAELLEQGGFDTSYRIVADYVCMLRCSLKADPQLLAGTLASFSVGGLSWTNWRPALAEFHRARIQVLQPHGRVALMERLDTARVWIATWTYRTLRPGST